MSQPYQSLEAELHDAFQESHGPSPELPLMESFLKRHRGQSLEIGCGSGRLTLPLKHKGFDIEGLELSQAMRELAAARSRAIKTPITIHAGDMSHWDPTHPYAALLAPAFTLQLADDPLSTLCHWLKWLEPGGGLYLTVFVPFAELTGEFPENEWYSDHQTTLPNGERALLETRHHFEQDRLLLIRQHRYSIEGRPDAHYECTQRIRWQEPWEWAEMLDGAGYELEHQFLDWDPDWAQERPGPEDYDGILTCIARKR